MSPRHTRISKFEIINPIGEGAASTVYLARDTIIGREVALKIVQPAALAAPDARERFFREALAASRLNHPNLVTTHEFGEDAGVVYLAMEHVAGEDLNELFLARSLQPRESLELLAQVCDALAYAHGKGVVHRDLRPSNVMITRVSGRPTAKVLDIGFTRLSGKAAATAGPILAPEQIQAGKPDPRADVFALGTILYEALAGINPFQAGDEAATRNRILKEEPPPLDLDRLDSISPAIQGILDRALAKDPARRFPTATSLAEALRAARNPGWSPEADAERLARDARARFVPNLRPPSAPGPSLLTVSIWLGGLVALVALGTGGWYLKHHHRAIPAPIATIQPVTQPVLQPMAQQAPEAVQPVPDPSPQPIPQPGVSPSTAPPQAQAPPVRAAEPPKPPAAGKSRFKSLDEAEDALPRNPSAALAHFEEVLAADPTNERAIALHIVALYDVALYGPCAKAMAAAKASGHTIMSLSLKCPPLHRMLQAEKEHPKLPQRSQPTQAH